MSEIWVEHDVIICFLADLFHVYVEQHLKNTTIFIIIGHTAHIAYPHRCYHHYSHYNIQLPADQLPLGSVVHLTASWPHAMVQRSHRQSAEIFYRQGRRLGEPWESRATSIFMYINK